MMDGKLREKLTRKFTSNNDTAIIVLHCIDLKIHCIYYNNNIGILLVHNKGTIQYQHSVFILSKPGLTLTLCIHYLLKEEELNRRNNDCMVNSQNLNTALQKLQVQ